MFGSHLFFPHFFIHCFSFIPTIIFFFIYNTDPVIFVIFCPSYFNLFSNLVANSFILKCCFLLFSLAYSLQKLFNVDSPSASLPLFWAVPSDWHLAPARYFHISYVQYLAVMSSKFIISLSQSANQINGYGFSTFL